MSNNIPPESLLTGASLAVCSILLCLYRQTLSQIDLYEQHSMIKLYRDKNFIRSQASNIDMSSDDLARTFSAEQLPNTNPNESLPSDSDSGLNALVLEQPLVIAMVGLPARGKSYLVKMLMRYLKWVGVECQVFNVGNFRRKVGLAAADSNFFDSSNPNASKVREELAMYVQDSMYEWLHEGAEKANRRVGIFDATNTTKARRLQLIQRARKENVFILFVESICDDQEVLNRNYELKLQNDDYKTMDSEKARVDFLSRVRAYEKVYETITDEEAGNKICYIKVINVGEKIITRNCHGYLPSQVAFYLQNVHIKPRKIYLSVIPESLEATLGSDRLAGAESGQLTSAGREYCYLLYNFLLNELILKDENDNLPPTAKRISRAPSQTFISSNDSLSSFLSNHSRIVNTQKDKDIYVLTGPSTIHNQATFLMKNDPYFRVFNTPLLNELRGGDMHGLSKPSMKAIYPEEYEKRQANKLIYRYPGIGGESYLDVIERVRPIIIELERQRRSIVVICHIAVLRCIYAYFMGVPLEELPHQNFEYHHIYELTPGPFGCVCNVISPHLVNSDGEIIDPSDGEESPLHHNLEI